MPSITDSAICIRRWDYSETSQTVSLLLREHGLLRGLVKGAKRAKGKFVGGVDVLNHGQVVAIAKHSSDLATVTEWHLVEVFRAVHEHLDANRAGLYMADLVHHMLTDSDPHPALFDALRRALAGLAEIDRIPRMVLEFEWTLLCETGYRPQLDRDAETGLALPQDTATLAFSSGAGGVVADTGGSDRWRVRRATIDLIRAVAAAAPADSASTQDERRAGHLLACYIRDLLGVEPKTMGWAFPEAGR